MTRIKEEKKIITAQEALLLKALEKEVDRLTDLLAICPSDSRLVAALNETDIKIVRITGEKTIDY